MSKDSRRPTDTDALVAAGQRDRARHYGAAGPVDDDVLADRTEAEREDIARSDHGDHRPSSADARPPASDG